MQQLSASRIPYGVLYDRVVGWAFLQEWKSGDTTSFVHIKQAWSDLENSTPAPTQTLETLKTRIDKAKSLQNIPLVSVNFGFGFVDSLALTDGRMRVENNQLIDAGGASPYLTQKVHLAALATDKLITGIAYQIATDNIYTLANLTDEPITGYTLQNITSGQTYTLPVVGKVNIVFNATGINALKITVHTAKGSYAAWQFIEVQASAPTLRSAGVNGTDPENLLLTSDIAFRGYEEPDASISYADYHIYYHYASPADTTSSERVLKKPIVILDGFDPQDSRNYNNIYYTQLKFGSENLGRELRRKGYDVVILNFPMTNSTVKELNDNGNIYIPEVSGFTRRDGGTDYIERNAFLLVKLIQTLNAKLAQNGSAEKLVIVGPSMGGQISRYALAYMEKQGMDHRTRIWLSFDSPHLGANIPLAIQKTLWFFAYVGGQVEAREGYEKKLHSSAARQMLVEQMEGYNGKAIFHKTYYAALNNNGLTGSGGWPQKVDKKLALVNGSGAGAANGEAGKKFLELRAKTKTWIKMKVAEIDNYYQIGRASCRERV